MRNICKNAMTCSDTNQDCVYIHFGSIFFSISRRIYDTHSSIATTRIKSYINSVITLEMLKIDGFIVILKFSRE